MKVRFRNEARAALKRAKEEIESADGARLRYAALELRLAIEALTYDRAQAFKKELPPAEYATWQPRQLLKVLLEIYPEADKGRTLSIGFSKMHSLGTEVVFDLKAVKEHYDALGSYLHVPTLKQAEEGRIFHDHQKTISRCKEIVELIETVLASPHWNSTLGEFSAMACTRCGKAIRRRLPADKGDTEAKCFECGAKYTLRLKGGDLVEWVPAGRRVPCPTTGCDGHRFFWLDELEPGTGFQCDHCNKVWMISLGFVERNHKHERGC